ncbi:MAG: DUF4832 domain-containing protein [Bacillota bacterium]|jgi:hypothetical protein|nr:DUF4832 domain-containing protein [Bacillota bacterium]
MIQRNKIKLIPLPRTERGNILQNPYCGMYSIYRFYAESIICQEKKHELDGIMMTTNQQICLVEINLISFNDKPLDEAALQNISLILEYFISHEKQIILRFVYDWEGKGILSEPKDIDYILQHMNQLSGILKGYEKHIYILQGLFIGSWGEMHNSRYLSERHMTRLAKQLYECSGDGTQIALRCPSYWRMIFRTFKPLNKETAYTKLMSSRFSLFNDGMLASETDFGTYGSVYAKEAENHNDKWIRHDELEFQNELCRYVSNGGEVINNCEYNDVAAAIEDLRTMRVSYLHSEYDKEVINKWKTNKSGLSDPIWQYRSAYEYIAAHLGYRFTLRDLKQPLHSSFEDRLRVNVKLCNTGFAPCYHSFEVGFLVRNSSYSELYEYRVDTDTRFWMPGEMVEIESAIDIDNLKANKYILCLRVYDPRTQRYIELANTFSSADYMGYYSIGIIEP